MSRVDINNLLNEMRQLKSQTQAFAKPAQADRAPGANGMRPGIQVTETQKTPGFGEMMTRAVNQVNETQKASGAMAAAYERGEPGVDIADVMIASQKASVSFQAAVQVRNKLVEAYRDIMNMPI